MTDITKIPTSELLSDKKASLADILLAQKLYTAKTLYGRPIDEVIKTNQKIVEKINKELKRRGYYG